MTDIADFDLDDLNATDTAEMTVMHNGKPTNWVWTFAGPGHPQTIAYGNKTSRERLQQERLKEQARVNGKKWSAPEESVDEVRARNVDMVVNRIVGWTPVRLSGEAYPFSAENARKLLLDPAKISLFAQAIEFIAEDNSFTKR